MTQFAVDHAPDAIYWIDENAQFVYANEAACESLGYTCDELLRMSVPDIDPTWPMEKWQATWDDLKKQGASTFETVHRTKQGRIFPVEIRTNFIEYHGRSMDCAYARDISDRKAAEETLRFTQYAVDKASDEAFWLTPDGRIVYVNEAVSHLLGYTKEELLGMTVQDVDPQYPIEMWEPHWQIVREKRTMTFESVHKTKDGHLIPVEITANYVEFEGSEYNFAIARDITERKKAEEALRFTQFAVDNASEETFWLTPDARIIYVNDAVCHLLGYTREELLNMTVHDIGPEYPPEVWEPHWQELREKRTMTFETVHKAKDGHLIPVEITANIVEYGGKEYNCAVARDITERKAAEEKLRFTRYALDSASDLVLWVCPDASFAYANKAVTEILGYTEEELLNMTVFDLNARFTAEVWPAHWNEVREKRVLTMEGDIRAKDGHMIPAEVRVNYVEFEGKEYHFTFVRDITERKRAEAERRALEQRLDEHKRKFYRETILSVTDGKLDICDPADLQPYLREAQAKIDILQPADVAGARKEVTGFCRLLGLPDEQTCSFVIGVGEAITNALKHGSGGRVYAGKSDREVWVGVKDKGPGIESLILPRAVLRRGFSTKPSLGLGYSIMLDVADRILLRTSTRGTTVVLIKSLDEDTSAPFGSVPDMWEGIPDTVG